MKQVIFLIEHFWLGVTFRPEDGNTTITSDLAIAWAALGIVQILGDGCGCGEKIEVAPGVTMEPVTRNPNRPFMPEEEEVGSSTVGRGQSAAATTHEPPETRNPKPETNKK